MLPLAGCTADAGCPLVECAWQAACESAPVTRAPLESTRVRCALCRQVSVLVRKEPRGRPARAKVGGRGRGEGTLIKELPKGG